MRKSGGKRMGRAIALLMSLVLVAGLSPAPALAAVGGIEKAPSSESTALVAGGGELAGQPGTQVQTQDGLKLAPLEVAIAKNLIEGALYGLGSATASWSTKTFLSDLFGGVLDDGSQKKLDEILQKLAEIEQSIETLKSDVEKVQLDDLLNDLRFLLGDPRSHELYKALADIDEQVRQGKMSSDEAEDARLTALTEGLGTDKDCANADLPFDQFTNNMWTAMTDTYNVTLGDKTQKLTLLQVHYELLRRSHKWEHQAYTEWASYQGKCVSLLISTLVLDIKSLEARLERLKQEGRQKDGYLVQARLNDLTEKLHRCVGYSTGLAGGKQKRTAGYFTEDTWAEQYWMYKERPDYRYYWVPGHEVLFFAEVNTQDVPQERSVSGLNDPKYLKGIKVKWSNGDMSIFDTYSVKINYDFWKPFLHYKGGNTPLASVDQLKTIYKDYGSDKHLYNIFIDKDEGNFTGLDEKGINKWWFVVDPGKDNSNVGYDKHTTRADVLWCRVLTSAHASRESAVLCKYHQAGSEPDKYRHYIGVGVARSGPETYVPGTDPNKALSLSLSTSSLQVHTTVQHNDAHTWPSNGNLMIGYDKAAQGAITKVLLNGKKLNKKHYKVKGNWISISKKHLAKLKRGKHKIVLKTKKGSHTVTFRVKKEQKVEVKTTNVNKTFGAKAFKVKAKAKSKLTYATSNKKVATVNAKGKVTVKGAGTAKIKIRAAETKTLAPQVATVTLKVAKAENAIALPDKTVTVKRSKLKKASQTVSIGKAKKAKGKVTYSITEAVQGNKSFAGKFSIDKATGKITVKKGLAAGTYKLTVKAKAGNANYKTVSTEAVVTVKVK